MVLRFWVGMFEIRNKDDYTFADKTALGYPAGSVYGIAYSRVV
jgi:hypothetical protein